MQISLVIISSSPMSSPLAKLVAKLFKINADCGAYLGEGVLGHDPILVRKALNFAAKDAYFRGVIAGALANTKLTLLKLIKL